MNRDVLGYVAMFSMLVMVALMFGILTWSINNDYMIAGVYNVSEGLEDKGLITSEIMGSIDEVASAHAQLSIWFDWFWLMAYVTFIGSTVALSYFAKQEDEFGFLGMLFYGTMVLLFIFSVSLVITNWLATVLFNVVPNLEASMPKFTYWLNWAGIYTFVHLIICMFANKIDLGMDRSFNRKSDTLEGGEIL